MPSVLSAPQIVQLTARRADSFGAASVAVLAEEAGLEETEARDALVLHGAEFLDAEWLWLPGARRNRLVTLARRILSVASPLDVAIVRAGVRRTYPSRRVGLVPPAEVVAALFRAHPAFAVDHLGRVAPEAELDYRAELGENDRLFVEVLRASWTGVLDRDSLREACAGRGMSARTFAACAAHSPVLDHPADDIWCLIGTRVSPITAAALRHAKAAALIDLA